MGASKRPASGPTAARRTLISILIALAVSSLIFVVFVLEKATHVDILSSAEAKLIDLRFRLRGPRQPAGDVVVVAIDSRSTERLGRWPWTRSTHARLIDQLREWGASTVAFDVLFNEVEGQQFAESLGRVEKALPTTADATLEPVRAALKSELDEVLADRRLAAAMKRAAKEDKALTVLAYHFALLSEVTDKRQLGDALPAQAEQVLLDIGSYQSRDENVARMRQAPPSVAVGMRPVATDLADWAVGLGYANPIHDHDGNIRRERLAIVYGPQLRQAYQDDSVDQVLASPNSSVQAFMPLSVAAVTTHLRLQVDDLVLGLDKGEVQFGKDRVHHFDPEDGTCWIDYYGGAGTIPTYSFADIVSGEVTDAAGNVVDGPATFAGKLVFVGATEPGLGDSFATPFTSLLPGVEKHATMAQNILSGGSVTTHRDPIVAAGLLLLATALVVGLTAGNLGAVASGAAMLAMLGGWLGFTYLDFVRHGMLWNWLFPVLGALLGYTAVTSYRQIQEGRSRRAMEERSAFVQNTFGRYLSDEVVGMILDSPSGLKLGGEKMRITILMSDLRGFTALCERSSPEVVLGMLNHYLGTMADLVLKHGGTVDEFIGDAILALFGAPVTKGDDARRAVACAVEMQRAMADVNRHCREQGLPEVEMGIALNTGDVIVGNIGSERRSKYGVVGSNVNLTARIESYTVGGQLLISGATLEEAGDIVSVGERIEVKAKGLKEPVPAYVVLGIGGSYNLEVPEIAEDLYDLPRPMQVQYGVLEGKQVSGATVRGSLVRLSKLGADLQTSQQLAPQTNVLLKLIGTTGDSDIYAKVVTRKAAAGCCALRFTAKPPAMERLLTIRFDEAKAHAEKRANADVVEVSSAIEEAIPDAEGPEKESDGGSAMFSGSE